MPDIKWIDVCQFASLVQSMRFGLWMYFSKRKLSGSNIVGNSGEETMGDPSTQAQATTISWDYHCIVQKCMYRYLGKTHIPAATFTVLGTGEDNTPSHRHQGRESGCTKAKSGEKTNLLGVVTYSDCMIVMRQTYRCTWHYSLQTRYMYCVWFWHSHTQQLEPKMKFRTEIFGLLVPRSGSSASKRLQKKHSAFCCARELLQGTETMRTTTRSNNRMNLPSDNFNRVSISDTRNGKRCKKSKEIKLKSIAYNWWEAEI